MARARGARSGDEASTHFKIGHMEPKPQSLNLKHESFVHYKCFMLESNSALNPQNSRLCGSLNMMQCTWPLWLHESFGCCQACLCFNQYSLCIYQLVCCSINTYVYIYIYIYKKKPCWRCTTDIQADCIDCICFVVCSVCSLSLAPIQHSRTCLLQMLVHAR